MKLSEEVARRMQMEEEMQGPGYGRAQFAINQNYRFFAGMGQEGAPAQPERVPLHLIDRAEHMRAVEERDRQIAALRQQVRTISSYFSFPEMISEFVTDSKLMNREKPKVFVQVELHERQLRDVRGELDDRMAVARVRFSTLFRIHENYILKFL